VAKRSNGSSGRVMRGLPQTTATSYHMGYNPPTERETSPAVVVDLEIFRLADLYNQAYGEYKHVFAGISRSALCCHSNATVHRSQICQ